MLILSFIILFFNMLLYPSERSFVVFKHNASNDSFTVPLQLFSTMPLFTTASSFEVQEKISDINIANEESFISIKKFFYLLDPSKVSYSITYNPIPNLNPALKFLQYERTKSTDEIIQRCAANYLPLLKTHGLINSIYQFFITLIYYFLPYETQPIPKTYNCNRIKKLLLPHQDNQDNDFSLYIIEKLFQEQNYSDISPQSQIIKEVDHQKELIWQGKTNSVPILERLRSQLIQIKYRNFMQDTHDESIYHRLLVILKEEQPSLIKYMMHKYTNENDSNHMCTLNQYIEKLVTTVLPSQKEPVVVGTYISQGLITFLKQLKLHGTLAYTFSGYVLESNPPQQDICISLIKDNKIILSIATLGHLSKIDASNNGVLKHDACYPNYSFYPNGNDVKEEPELLYKRELLIFIQSLQRLSDFNLKVPKTNACYWGWSQPPEDL